MAVNKRSMTEWRELIAQYEASGLSQEDWCLANGVNLYTMRDRARRLRQLDNQGGDDQVSGTKTRKNWVEVKELNREQSCGPATQASAGSRPDEAYRSEIRISAGVFTVSVSDRFNEAALIRVLNALGGLDGVRREVAS